MEDSHPLGHLRTAVSRAACFLALAGCAGPPDSPAESDEPQPRAKATAPGVPTPPDLGTGRQSPGPLSDFVRRIFQDQRGHLWFGTNGDGVARYDGDTLEYFSEDEGFGGTAIRGIVEDKESNVWFGTENGLTRYDGASFVNFGRKNGLAGNNVWSLLADSQGVLWVGTLEGVSRFDGEQFTPFALPESPVDRASEAV